jgi:hypothetical protein
LDGRIIFLETWAIFVEHEVTASFFHLQSNAAICTRTAKMDGRLIEFTVKIFEAADPAPILIVAIAAKAAMLIDVNDSLLLLGHGKSSNEHGSVRV